MGVAGVEERLGGALGGTYNLDSEAFIALEVLDDLDAVAVAGDEDVGVGVGGEAHHVHDDYADVPVVLVGDRPPLSRVGVSCTWRGLERTL